MITIQGKGVSKGIAKGPLYFFQRSDTITKNGTTVKAGQLMKLMSLGVKQGDVVTVAAEGANEDAAIAALTAFFNNNL